MVRGGKKSYKAYIRHLKLRKIPGRFIFEAEIYFKPKEFALNSDIHSNTR